MTDESTLRAIRETGEGLRRYHAARGWVTYGHPQSPEEAAAMMAPGSLVRVSASTAPTDAEPDRVHVIFARSHDGHRPQHYQEARGYYMTAATYHAIPYGAEATPADYAYHGRLQEAPPVFYFAPAEPPAVRVVELADRLAEGRATVARLRMEASGALVVEDTHATESELNRAPTQGALI